MPVIVGGVESNVTDDASLVVVKFTSGTFPARSIKLSLVTLNGMGVGSPEPSTWVSPSAIVLVAV